MYIIIQKCGNFNILGQILGQFDKLTLSNPISVRSISIKVFSLEWQ